MIFISYSKDDKEWKNRILTHLNGIETTFSDNFVWYDDKIKEGEKWHAAIEKAKSETEIAILLVSEKYLASSYIRNFEFTYFLQREIPIYWFLITECVWKRSGLNELQCANVKYGNRLIPLDMEHPSNLNKILAETCESIYDTFKTLKKHKDVRFPAKREPIPNNFRFTYNRNHELELVELCYRYFYANEHTLLFSIQGEPTDSLETFSKSFIYKSLCDTAREITFDKVLELKIDISNLYQYKLTTSDCIKVMFLNDFYVHARKKLELGYKLENLSYKSFANICNKEIEWIIIPIKIQATLFSQTLIDVIFSWVTTEFNKENYSKENFKIIFIFSFENSTDSDLNTKMNNYINHTKEWFVPLYNVINSSLEDISKDVKKPFVYHLGMHGKTTLTQFEKWCKEEGLRYKNEKTYKSLKKSLKDFENYLDLNSVWSLFDHIEKI